MNNQVFSPMHVATAEFLVIFRMHQCHSDSDNAILQIERETTRSPDVLSSRTLFLSLFGSLFLSSHQQFRWGATPNARC